MNNQIMLDLIIIGVEVFKPFKLNNIRFIVCISLIKQLHSFINNDFT